MADQHRKMTAQIFRTPELYLGNMTLNDGISEGLRNVLLAGLRNSSEASARVADPYIEVLIDGNSISFKNKGTITLNYDGAYYIPEIVFGMVFGRTLGMCIKLINSFSKFFRVTIGNLAEQRHYDQLWQHNAHIKHDPIITEYHGPDFVKITFELDFERFDCTSLTQEMIDVLGDYCKTIDKSITLLGYFAELQQEQIKEPCE